MLRNYNIFQPKIQSKFHSIREYRRTGRDIFLDHSKQRLRAPLTYTVPDKHIGTVSQCFRNILGWMNDRPVQDAKRVILAFTVVAVARKEISLRNEIYIQAIKQCRNNPNAKSEMLGWKLLLLLSQEAAPKADLVEFIVAFFRQGVEKNRHKPDRVLQALHPMFLPPYQIIV